MSVTLQFVKIFSCKYLLKTQKHIYHVNNLSSKLNCTSAELQLHSVSQPLIRTALPIAQSMLLDDSMICFSTYLFIQ